MKVLSFFFTFKNKPWIYCKKNSEKDHVPFQLKKNHLDPTKNGIKHFENLAFHHIFPPPPPLPQQPAKLDFLD